MSAPQQPDQMSALASEIRGAFIRDPNEPFVQDADLALEELLRRLAATEAALRKAVEAIEKHDEWCGHNPNAPGNAIWHETLYLAREALRDAQDG